MKGIGALQAVRREITASMAVPAVLKGEDSSGFSESLREIRMEPCKELESYGFGATFGQLVNDEFPDR